MQVICTIIYLCWISFHINPVLSSLIHIAEQRTYKIDAMRFEPLHWGRLQSRCPILTQWSRVTHIGVSKLTIIGSDNGLPPGRRQAIIRTNAEILLIRTLGTNFSEILGESHSFSFSKMHWKMSSAKWRLFGLGFNELTHLPGQIGRHVTDNIFRCIFMDGKFCILIKNFSEVCPKCSIDNNPAVV